MPADPWQFDSPGDFVGNAVLLPDFLQAVKDSHALGSVVAGNFGEHQGPLHGVLVAGEGLEEVAVAFFKAHQELAVPFLVHPVDFFTDVLEASQN